MKDESILLSLLILRRLIWKVLIFYPNAPFVEQWKEGRVLNLAKKGMEGVFPLSLFADTGRKFQLPLCPLCPHIKGIRFPSQKKEKSPSLLPLCHICKHEREQNLDFLRRKEEVGKSSRLFARKWRKVSFFGASTLPFPSHFRRKNWRKFSYFFELTRPE